MLVARLAVPMVLLVTLSGCEEGVLPDVAQAASLDEFEQLVSGDADCAELNERVRGLTSADVSSEEELDRIRALVSAACPLLPTDDVGPLLESAEARDDFERLFRGGANCSQLRERLAELTDGVPTNGEVDATMGAEIGAFVEYVCRITPIPGATEPSESADTGCLAAADDEVATLLGSLTAGATGTLDDLDAALSDQVEDLPVGYPDLLAAIAEACDVLAPRTFAVYVNGFMTIRQTRDAEFDSDGNDDEVAVVALVAETPSDGFLVLETDAELVAGNDPSGTFIESSTYGQPGGAGRTTIRGPNEAADGGLNDGDLIGSRVFQVDRDQYDMPFKLWEGTLAPGRNGAVIIPMLWEIDDASGPILTNGLDEEVRELRDALRSQASAMLFAAANSVRDEVGIPHSLGAVPHIIAGSLPAGSLLPARALADVFPAAVDLLEEFIFAFKTGSQFDRPIGMRPDPADTGDVFGNNAGALYNVPSMLLTYETAQLMAATEGADLTIGSLSGVDGIRDALDTDGTVVMRFTDTNTAPLGDYLLFLSVVEVS